MNTRVAVPLTQEAYDAVSHIAGIEGISRGRFLANILEAAMPSVVMISAGFRAAESMSKEETAEYLRGIQQANETLAQAVSGLFDIQGSDGVEHGASGPAGGRSTSRADPPDSNRGVHNLAGGEKS